MHPDAHPDQLALAEEMGRIERAITAPLMGNVIGDTTLSTVRAAVERAVLGQVVVVDDRSLVVEQVHMNMNMEDGTCHVDYKLRPLWAGAFLTRSRLAEHEFARPFEILGVSPEASW